MAPYAAYENLIGDALEDTYTQIHLQYHPNMSETPTGSSKHAESPLVSQEDAEDKE